MSSTAELDAFDPAALDRRHVVLLVDDEPEVLAALRRSLRGEPYEILTAGDADEAFGLLARHPVDLVVADHRMPGMCGTDFLGEVRHRAPWAQRVLLTGFPAQARVRFGLGGEIQELVTKPWNDDGLRLTLRARLRETEGTAWADSCGADRLRLQAQMIQAQKLQAIGQLTAGIAHEINNPVGYILSNLSTVIDYAHDLSRLLTFALSAAERLPEGDPEKERIRSLAKALEAPFLIEDFRKALEESRQGAERIRDLVRSLKAFTHVDDGEPAPVDLREAVQNALRIAHNELKYKATVHCDLEEVPPVMGHVLGLEQVLVNLLVNAAQAIEKRGEIFVRLAREGGEAILEVRDTGPGISPENQKRLFQPFFTTKPVGKGTGLGLHIAAQIVRAHHGRIEARSERGHGAEFIIRLPLGGSAVEDSP